ARRSDGGGALDLEFHPLTENPGAAAVLIMPDDTDLRGRYESDLRRFCALIPDAFYISERGRIYLEQGEDAANTGRFLSAGLHNQMGYFRDDQPLYELI